MPNRPHPVILAHLASATAADEPDAELLGRFVRDRDPAAFASLVRRHGPMVLGVCRRALGDTPDAEDAFQAVWLVLVRKAAAVSPRGMVGNWLYGVATRTATHARTRAARVQARREELPDLPDPRATEPGAGEVADAVGGEVARLPDRYRAAVVLCELEGRPLKEAAGVLGVPVGTLASRLARGRAVLADRLRSRGFAVAALAGWFATASARVPDSLADRAVALAGPAAVPDSVSELARGVASAMFTNKLKWLVRAVAVVGLVTAAAVAWAVARPAAPQPAADPPPQGNDFADRLNPPGTKDWTETLWDDLMSLDEPRASRAVLTYYRYIPKKDQVPFLKGKLKPLKADKEATRKRIADLGSDKEPVWKAAFADLCYFDPRLALNPVEAMAEAKTPPARRRLGAILMNSNDPARFAGGEVKMVYEEMGMFLMNDPLVPDTPLSTYRLLIFPVAEVRRPEWVRLVRAIVILENVGGPDALAVLKEMATGHPDAQPTIVAKEAVANLTRPTP
jgi:RNA polymerase sigma factor (sigma-70 family)